MNDTACVFGSKFRMRGLPNEVLCMALPQLNSKQSPAPTDLDTWVFRLFLLFHKERTEIEGSDFMALSL